MASELLLALKEIKNLDNLTIGAIVGISLRSLWHEAVKVLRLIPEIHKMSKRTLEVQDSLIKHLDLDCKDTKDI